MVKGEQKGKEKEVVKMATIVKTRGSKNVSSPVKMALYDASLSTVKWDDIMGMEPINVSKAVNNSKGIRSTLDMGVVLSDIQGCTVGMLVKEGTTVYRDVVTIRGATNTGVIVTFDDEPDVTYTINKSQVRFVKGTD